LNAAALPPARHWQPLPDEIRLAVRDEVRRDFGDTRGPIEVEAEYRIGSGRR